MASEQRLYTFSAETKEQLRKFRLGTSRAKDPQALIYKIDKATLEVSQDGSTVYSSLEDIADALPENTPRFALLSYPMTLASGRSSAPYVLLSYLPPTSSAEQRMMYAGARELVRAEAQAGRLLEVEDEEGVLGVRAQLEGGE